MPQINANGITIEYDTFGDQQNPAITLIMGLGGQMIAWDESFCEDLAQKGYFVIRHDNRDIGLSQWFDDEGMPDVMQGFTDFLEGKEVQASYSLDDMADDTVGLLDALEIEKAHICGVSMGGAITQVIGYRHASRVLSLLPCDKGWISKDAECNYLIAQTISVGEDAEVKSAIVWDSLKMETGAEIDELEMLTTTFLDIHQDSLIKKKTELGIDEFRAAIHMRLQVVLESAISQLE